MLSTSAQTTYRFAGRLCGLLCSDCSEPLAVGTVKLYRVQGEQDILARAVADPKDTFAILTDETIAAKAKYLMATSNVNANGEFIFELGANQNYNGEAFEIDFECGTPPFPRPVPQMPRALQFSITTLQPLWRRAKRSQELQPSALLSAFWDYCLPSRFWCAIRARFGLWTICGRVLDCQTQKPVAGVKVSAFDTDIFQDDALGFTLTATNGQFRIDYLAEDFQKTPFSPLINFEIFSGPDLYFKVETSGGVVLLDEPRLRGRQSDRSNVGNCFCVDLCVEEPTPPGGKIDNPIFTHVGDFSIISDINPANGLTRWGLLGHSGPGFGFFSTLKLKGYCSAKAPGGSGLPMRYRFLYQYLDTVSAELPITEGLLAPQVVGVRKILFDLNSDGILEETFQSIVVAPISYSPPPSLPPQLVLNPDANGWVQVDADAWGGFFGNVLLGVRSDLMVTGGAAVEAGDLAGNLPSSLKNGRPVKIIFEAEPVGGGAPLFRDELLRIFINNWAEVGLLNLAQFLAPGANSCAELSTALDVRYTVDHQFLFDWAISITSASLSAPGTVLPPLPASATSRGGAGTLSFNISTWQSCSYTVALSARRKLTNGESDDPNNSLAVVTFCK